MCNPAFIPIAISAFSALTKAKADEAQGSYQKGVADYNARVTENAAQDVRNQGNEAENAQREQTAQLISRQRAQLGANGVDLSTGSALQLQEDAQTLGDADALRIRSNVASKVNSLKTQATLTKADGEMNLLAGKNAATGSLLEGASRVADKWYSRKD